MSDPSLVVAFRTHLWDADIAVLARRLAFFAQGVEFVVLADETHGALATGHFKKLAHNDDFSGYGLPNFPAGRVLWYNGDYPLYVLRRAYPHASHIAMVEYDVAVNTDIMPMLHAARERGIDLIAENIQPAYEGWYWKHTAEAHFAEPLKAFIPLMVASARAIDALLAARIALFGERELKHLTDWPFCEAFIPSVIAGMEGALIVELKEFAQLVHFTFRPERHLNDPHVNQFGTICHPVAGGDIFIRRRLDWDKPEAILDPASDLRQQLMFCDPARFAALFEARLRADRAELLPRYREMAAELGWPLPAEPDASRRFLVVLRAGRTSEHVHWLNGDVARRFDLVICPYQDMPVEQAALMQSATMPGQKWSGLHRFLLEWPDWRNYDYIWLPDDDLQTDCGAINTMFDLSVRFGTAISAPSLSEDSYFSHALTMHHRHFFARAVTFVELMMPCFRRDVLEQMLPTFAASKTGYGWGLDNVWPYLARFENIMIFDTVTVRHKRPLGSVRDPALSQQIVAEMYAVVAQYGAKVVQKTLGGYDSEGRFTPEASPFFALDYLGGYRYLFDIDERILQVLVDTQAVQLPALPPPLAMNVARGRPALASSQAEGEGTGAAGGNNGVINCGFGFHTELELDPWWQVDLEAAHKVERVVLFNRAANAQRCTRVSISGSLDGRNWAIEGVKLDGAIFGGADGNPYVFKFEPAFVARYVRVTLIGRDYLHLDEVEVYGVPAA